MAEYKTDDGLDAVILGDPYDDLSGMVRRPGAPAAVAAIRNFVGCKIGNHDFPLTIVPDGDFDSAPNKCGWAFWLVEGDSTSYLKEDLSIEWLGTSWTPGQDDDDACGGGE